MESDLASPRTHALGSPRTGNDPHVGDAAVVRRPKFRTLILG